MSESVESFGRREANNQSEHLSGNRKIRTFVRDAHHRVKRNVSKHLCVFGRAIAGIWPVKPALHLAQLCDISDRGAELIMDGERKVPAKVLNAVDRFEIS